MIGIIPIGGHATRMNGIPKFLLPIGNTCLLTRLYEQMAAAGAETIAVGVRAEHRHLAEQNLPGEAVIYEVNTETMSQTVLHARPHIDMTQPVLFGMPDTFWTDEGVYEELAFNLDVFDNTAATAALWIVDRAYRHKRGMVRFEDYRYLEHLLAIEDKPIVTDLVWGWMAIAWRPSFWQYINPYDKHVGFAMQRAIEAGEFLSGKVFSGFAYDCGTPDEYYECIRSTAQPTE